MHGSVPSHLSGKGSELLTASPLVTGSHLASSSPLWPCLCCHSPAGVVTGPVGGVGEGLPSAAVLSSQWEPGVRLGRVRVRPMPCSILGWGKVVPSLSEPAVTRCVWWGSLACL